MATLTVIGNAASAPPAMGACSCYLVEAAGTRIVLDLGPGALPRLRAATEVRALDAIFISHMHTDHWIDLLALNVAFWTEEPRAAEGELRPVALYLPPGGLALVDEAFGVLSRGVPGTMAGRWRQAFAAREYDPGEIVRCGPLAVSFVGPTRHATTNYAMRVDSGEGVLAYTGDTAPCREAVEAGGGASLFLGECTLLEPGPQSETHTAAAELGAMAREAGAARLLATHISRQDGAWRAQLLSRLAPAFGGPVEVVHLGDTWGF